MLVSQLCVFDDESDSKSKWVKKHILWLCCPKYLVYLWVKISISIWDMVVVNLHICLIIMMHAKWMCNALTQRTRTIKQLKVSSSTKSVHKFITIKTQGISLECWDHSGKIKSTS